MTKWHFSLFERLKSLKSLFVDAEPSQSLVLKCKVYTYWSEKKYFHIQIPRKITENQSPQKSLNKKPQRAGRKMGKKIKGLNYRENHAFTEQGWRRNAINFCKDVFVLLNGVDLKLSRKKWAERGRNNEVLRNRLFLWPYGTCLQLLWQMTSGYSFHWGQGHRSPVKL